MFIESTPTNATIFLDGKQKGKTPYELKGVSVGSHLIQLKKGNLYQAEFEINLEVDVFVKRLVMLERTNGKIKITSEPYGALIFLDGKDTGMKTPDVISTESGEHELKLWMKGKVYEGKVNVDPSQKIEEHVTNFKEINIPNMVLIKGGCFNMGETFIGDEELIPPPEPEVVDMNNSKFNALSLLASEDQYDLNDKKEQLAVAPVHEVCLDDFFLSDHEVTQGEWMEVMGHNPSGFKDCGDDCPVETVSWENVQVYIRKLNQKVGPIYRLPTEAEWEYAARGGSQNEKWAGVISEASLADYAWYGNNADSMTHPVKTKLPNGFGLYDMTGNVREWVADRFCRKYFNSSPRKNPKESERIRKNPKESERPREWFQLCV